MRYLYIHTHGIETPERTATPIYLATTAAMLEFEATVVFTITATSILKKGVAENLRVKEGGQNLLFFIRQAKENGVKLIVCAPSLDLNDMTQDDLIPEVDEIIGGAALNDMAADADVLFTF